LTAITVIDCFVDVDKWRINRAL